MKHSDRSRQAGLLSEWSQIDCRHAHVPLSQSYDHCALAKMAYNTVHGSLLGSRPLPQATLASSPRAQSLHRARASSPDSVRVVQGQCMGQSLVTLRASSARRGASTVVCAARPHKVALLGIQLRLILMRIDPVMRNDKRIVSDITGLDPR